MTTDERFDALMAAVKALASKMDERFTSIHQRLDRIDDSLRQLKETTDRLDILERQFTLFSSVVTSLDTRLPALFKTVVELELSLGQMKREQPGVLNDWYGRLMRLEEQVSKLLPAA